MKVPLHALLHFTLFVSLWASNHPIQVLQRHWADADATPVDRQRLALVYLREADAAGSSSFVKRALDRIRWLR